MALGNQKKGWVFTTHSPHGAMGKTGAARGLAGSGVCCPRCSAHLLCLCVFAGEDGEAGGCGRNAEDPQRPLKKPLPQVANLHDWPKCEIRGAWEGEEGDREILPGSLSTWVKSGEGNLGEAGGRLTRSHPEGKREPTKPHGCFQPGVIHLNVCELVLWFFRRRGKNLGPWDPDTSSGY